MKKTTINTLSKIYTDPSHPAGYSTVNKLWKAVNKTISKTEILEWLQTQDSYTLHRPIRRRFERNRYNVDNMDDLWEADLCDMRSFKKFNEDMSYILIVIDVFSKFAFAVATRSKSSGDIVLGFEKIFSTTRRRPVRLNTDKGKEFTNGQLQKFLKNSNVMYSHTNNDDTKAAVVERLIRTIKTRMWQYFTSKSTYRYIDILDKLISAYNSTVHRSIGMPPRDVNESNILKVWETLYNRHAKRATKTKLSVGDNVRISNARLHFKKGYEAGWSEEIFTIKRVLKRRPPVYNIVDLNSEDIQGVFYEPELQRVRVTKSTEYKIEKVVKTKGKGVNKQVFVKWRGYTDEYNSWIPISQLRSL